MRCSVSASSSARPLPAAWVRVKGMGSVSSMQINVTESLNDAIRGAHTRPA